MEKLPFDIAVALERIEQAVQPWPKAALFQLADEGYRSVFEQLVACMISIRTYDEVTLPVSRKLFAQARTPTEIAALTWEELNALISPCTFHERKASQILAIARDIEAKHGGELPGERDVLLSLAGVGPKCANLVLGVACGTPVISVDIHVHRVTGRWGYVKAPTRKKPCWRWKRSCRANTGSTSTGYWSRLASTFVRGAGRSVLRVRCWRCAGRWG